MDKRVRKHKSLAHSPLSWFLDKSSVFKALNPAIADGIAPEVGTEKYNEKHLTCHDYMNKSLKNMRSLASQVDTKRRIQKSYTV